MISNMGSPKDDLYYEKLAWNCELDMAYRDDDYDDDEEDEYEEEDSCYLS